MPATFKYSVHASRADCSVAQLGFSTEADLVWALGGVIPGDEEGLWGAVRLIEARHGGHRPCQGAAVRERAQHGLVHVVQPLGGRLCALLGLYAERQQLPWLVPLQRGVSDKSVMHMASEELSPCSPSDTIV